MHLFQGNCIVFAPTDPYLHILRFTLGLYRIDMGSLLSNVAMSLNMPLQAIVRPTHSDKIGRPLLQLPWVCI